MADAPTPVAIPPINLPFLGSNGTVSLAWYRFLQQLGSGGDASGSIAGLTAEIAAAEAEAALAKTDAEAALTLAQSLEDIVNDAEVLGYVASAIDAPMKPADFSQVLPFLGVADLDNGPKRPDANQILPLVGLSALDLERLQVLLSGTSVLHDVKSLNFAGPPVATVTAAGKDITVTLAAVTSVGLSAPGIFTVSGSPVTTTGTLTFTLNTQTANTVFAGPSSGAAAAPTFRALVSADIPSVPATITTQNQGTTLSSTVSTLNFTGVGVVASGSGATTTITVASLYDIAMGYSIALPASTIVLTFISPREFSLPINCTGSECTALTVPSATTTLTIEKNGSSVGTISVSTGGVGTFTMATSTTWNAGDLLEIVTGATVNAIGNVAITFLATRLT